MNLRHQQEGSPRNGHARKGLAARPNVSKYPMDSLMPWLVRKRCIVEGSTGGGTS